MIDLNGDGVGDIWALKYSAADLAATADFDGDGKTNAQESIAGTNPFDASSSLAISSLVLDSNGLELTWPTVAGKLYQVQTTTTFLPPSWAAEGPPVIGTGEKETRTLDPINPGQKYYRVIVQDLDSDGDQVSDWEETAVGSDLNRTHTRGLAESDDLAHLKAALQATNVVSVTATDPNASEVGLDTGTFVFRRNGNLNAITIIYTIGGDATAGVDYLALSGSVTLGLGQETATVVVRPLTDAQIESPESVIVTLTQSPAYTRGTPSAAAVLIGDTIGVNAAGAGGLNAQFWNEATSGASRPSETVPAQFPGAPVLSRIDSKIDFDWSGSSTPGVGSPGSTVTADYFSSRWTGEVLPEFSQTYAFYFDSNLAGRVWVNGQLVVNNWPGGAASVAAGENAGGITLVAGVRYPILVEHYETNGIAGAHLSWSSMSRAREIIPQTRLFPNRSPQILSPTEVTILKGSGPYVYQLAASGAPTSYQVQNAPPGWSFNPSNAQLSGSPTQAGVWNVLLSAANAYGSGSALLKLTVIETAGAITREVWDGSFGNLSGLPLASTPTSTALVSSLEAPLDAGTNYGSRLRGYITAPATGAYQFWLAADDQAELWISNDDEPINLIKRAAATTATGYRNWGASAKTPLLWLKIGQRYYVEVRHAETSGSDYVSVGWFKPTNTGTGSTPSEIVPGYALSPWVPLSGATAEGTLYTANLTPQTGAMTSGYGSATLRLSQDSTLAVLNFTYGNLSSDMTGSHVHSGTDNGAIIFDIDDATPNEDGSFTWPITGAGALSAQQISNVIKSGNAYLNIHTASYPTGEIKGFFRLQDGSQTFTPPAAPPAWPDDHTAMSAATRFLNQSTFGSTYTGISAVQTLGYEGWINDQFSKSATHSLDYVEANKSSITPPYPTRLATEAWWKNSVTAPDQLRQRVAFALSEILVVSSAGVLEEDANAIAVYYDILVDNAFGNFRNLLESITLNPAMGVFLDMRRNDKPDKGAGRVPNENYAREIMQLFSLGVNRLHPDGSLMLTSKGLPISTYDQETVIGFAHAFTGWDFNQPDVDGYLPMNFAPAAEFMNPMKAVPWHHFTGQKRILNNVVLPGLAMVGGEPLRPYYIHSVAQIQDPAYQALPAQEIDATHDAIFNHSNVGPFICRQLIQRLVTSTPSRGYIYRVVQKFNDNGAGVRGDLKAVVKAILLDYEARSSELLNQQGFGKQREPLLRISAIARAFSPPLALAGNYAQDGGLITVTTSPTPHRLMAGNQVGLNFSGSGVPATSGNYSVTSAAPINTFTFSVRAEDCIRATYSQSGGKITVNSPVPHGFATGQSAYIRFRTGNSGVPDNGRYAVTITTAMQFTVNGGTSATRNGEADVAFLRGGYAQSGTTVTLISDTVHGLSNGDSVHVFFTEQNSAVTPPPTGVYSVTVLDGKRFNITVSTSGTRVGSFFAGPSAATLSRSGSVATSFSSWQVRTTEYDLLQTPLRAPSVFNYFESDYQFPGKLAEAGLVTPEFQITSETNVIRQANYINMGLSRPWTNTSGLSSFSEGDGSITIDLSPYMGNAPGQSTAWVSDANVGSLLDELNSLLTGVPMPAGMREVILTFVAGPSPGPKNLPLSATPTDEEKLDRLRAMLHLLVTSPHFTIQK